MKIQDIVRKTGLSKRTIYFYMKEKLVLPQVDKWNGYHDFSEEDVKRLILIRKLRDADLSISEIRSIIANPRTLDFYLHNQLNHLQGKIMIMKEVLKNLDEFSAHLPTCDTIEELTEQFLNVEFKPNVSQYQFHFESRDARMITKYFYQVYMDIPMTEYRQFLWQKVMDYTVEEARTNLKAMSLFLQYLPPEKLDEMGKSQSLRNKKIISLNKDDYPSFVKELIDSICRFASDSTQKEQWDLLYEPVIRPATVFGFEVSPWLLEFHPDYKRYYENIHNCCMQLKEYIDSPAGTDFKQTLKAAFGSEYNFDASSYGEFEVAASFKQSIYSLLSPPELRKFLAPFCNEFQGSG